LLVALSSDDPCGERKWLLKNELLMWKAGSSTADYHSHMNFENYEK
jgi:hypothetical protein